MTTMGLRPIFSALETTNLVCGSGPSAASTSTSAPSTMFKIRSTSPPKSAWPGVSTILMRVSFHTTEAALAKIVIPRSRSRSLESIARSITRWFSRNVPDCCNRRSTSVVLPWSTCAMMATFRRFISSSGNQSAGPSARDAALLRCNIVTDAADATAQAAWPQTRLSACRSTPWSDSDAPRQRVLQHHHFGDGFAGDEPDQFACGVGDADRRSRFLLQQLERLLQRDAVADRRQLGSHRIGYPRIRAARLDGTNQIATAQHAHGLAGAVYHGKFPLTRLQQCLHRFIDVRFR